MQPHEMPVWIPVVLAIWLVPFVASVIERRFIRERLTPLLDAFKRQSAPTQTFIVIFLIAAILYGGTKPSQSPQATSCASSPGVMPIEEEEPSEVVAPNALFRITDFVVASDAQAVGFEVAWASNAFDCAASRSVDVFMSTNLLTRNWFWLNRLVLPTGTNAHAFALGGADVAPGVQEVFTNAFGRMAFFATGLDVDADGDSLTDAFERLVVGSSPVRTDSDFDGVDDGAELDLGTDANDADTDADGYDDGEENAAGQSPTVFTDGAATTIRYHYDDDDRLTGSYSGAGQGVSAVALTPAGNPAVRNERSAR